MNIKENLQEYTESVKDFILNEIEPYTKEIEENAQIPQKVWDMVREKGLMNLRLPEKYGGAGLTVSEYLPILENVAQSHGAVRMMVHVNNGIWKILHYYGSPEQQKRWLKPFANGEIFIAFALTEPNAGTGLDIKTTAEEDGDHFILNGKKHLITFSDVAGLYHVVAKTDPNGGEESLTMFAIEPDTPGFTRITHDEVMGVRGTGHEVLVFENAKVPKENVVGKVGQGLEIALRAFLDGSRVSLANCSVGLAQRALDLAVDYAKKRVTFGKPIAERQAIQMMLGEMQTDVTQSRLLVHQAAKLEDEGKDFTAIAAMAKLSSLEMVQRVTDKTLQIYGGIGYTSAYPVERIYRDARAFRFEEGTAEIQKIVIARSIL